MVILGGVGVSCEQGVPVGILPEYLKQETAGAEEQGEDDLPILVYLVIYDSGWVSLEHLPSYKNLVSQPALSLSTLPPCRHSSGVFERRQRRGGGPGGG